MTDSSAVSEICATIRARVHEALEARKNQQPCSLSRRDVASDIFALRSHYLVCFKCSSGMASDVFCAFFFCVCVRVFPFLIRSWTALCAVSLL